MKTPAQLQDRYGLSYGMIRKYVIELLPEGVQFSKNMNLNGTSKKVIQAIADRSTDPEVKEKALNDLEQMIKPVERPVEPIKQYVDQWLNPVECTLNGFSPTIKQALNEIKQDEPEVKEPLNLTRNISIGIQSFFEFDLGRAILGSPLIRFLFVCAMIAGQSYMFAMLEQKVMEGTGFDIAIGYAVAVGALFEAVGFMIALSIDPKRMLGEYPVRNLMLSGFFIFQCITNLCLIEPFSVPGLALPAGRFIIAIALPGGIAAYSFLYFKEQK